MLNGGKAVKRNQKVMDYDKLETNYIDIVLQCQLYNYTFSSQDHCKKKEILDSFKFLRLVFSQSPLEDMSNKHKS